MIQDEEQREGNGCVLFKGCDDVLDHLVSSLWATLEEVACGVAPLDKD
jgi:hypothetical protein